MHRPLPTPLRLNARPWTRSIVFHTINRAKARRGAPAAALLTLGGYGRSFQCWYRSELDRVGRSDL